MRKLNIFQKLFCVVIVTFFSSNLIAGLGTITNIMTTEDLKANGYDDSKKVVRNSAGTLFFVTRKKSGSWYQVFISKSTDNGTTWSAGTAIATITTNHARVPSIAIDGNDNLHVVWYQCDPVFNGTDERVIKYSKSTDDGATWSSWINIGAPTGYSTVSGIYWQEHPVITVGSNNTLYVVWEGRDISTGTNGKVFFTKSTDGGTTWSAYSIVNTGTSVTQSRPTIIVDGNNKLYVFMYSSLSTGAVRIWMSTSTDGGTNWSNWTAVSDGSSIYDARHVSVAASSDNTIHMVWRQFTATSTTRSKILYRSYDGASFTTIETISDNTSTNYHIFPSIAVDANDKLHVVYWQSTTGTSYPSEEPTEGEIYYINKLTALWSSATRLSDGTGTATWPIIRYSNYFMNGSNIDITWLQGTASPYTLKHYAVAVVLPLAFNSFIVNRDNTNVILNWECSHNSNITKFIVQKSLDGINFFDIAEVSSTLNTSYGYTDRNTPNIKLYYRLKEVQLDNSIYHSVIKIVQGGEKKYKLLNNFSTSNIILWTAENEQNTISCFIYDMSGRLYNRKNIPLQEGTQISPIDITALHRGLYMLVIKNNRNNQIQNFRFTKN